MAGERMTPRDLVTHRSGLPRHDLVWYASALSRMELVSRLEFLEPSANLGGAGLPEVVARQAIDRLLRLPPIDWSARLRERRETGRKAEKAWKAKGAEERETWNATPTDPAMSERS